MNAATQPDADKPKLSPRKLRRTIYWLTLDWIHLRATLPQPPRPAGRPTGNHNYGHPAEWASDKAAQIVDILASWHDLLAEHRNEHPPPRGSEQRRITAAWKYLEPRCEQLVELVEPEALSELPALHHKIRNTLGYTRAKYTLPIPCPNIDCQNLRTLVRIVGIGRDFISCDLCGYTIKEIHYPLLIRMALDAFIADNCHTQAV